LQGRASDGGDGIRRLLVLSSVAALLAACAGPRATSPPASAPARPVDVLTAPVRVAQTAAGPVGYRIVGRGTPLVLITGFSASIDNWPPAFVDALATRHRVVVLDNAGVGRTGDLPAPLSVSEMADQTSAVISTLRLGRTAVLGWSMGGMIAQALAVLHPSQVSRLVLAATQAGTGAALPVPPAAAAAAASTNPAAVLGVLFPATAVIAEQTYVKGILSYPGYYQAPPSVKMAQTAAIDQWLAGSDPTGPREKDLRVPTLVADGSVDELNPVANDRLLATIIRGAQLVIYPGAGHAFLFQDAVTFVPRLETFLG
jgi:pimeloyl-ACP methyl ester carboxylesterase